MREIKYEEREHARYLREIAAEFLSLFAVAVSLKNGRISRQRRRRGFVTFYLAGVRVCDSSFFFKCIGNGAGSVSLRGTGRYIGSIGLRVLEGIQVV